VRPYHKKTNLSGHWWLKPVILATQEAGIRRTEVQSQHGANSLQEPILKKKKEKMAGSVAQEVTALSSNSRATQKKA
jgi:hypothetical protein